MIQFRNISKRFPGVQALNDVTLEIRRGACHALVGENGAGKSTLGKILAGIYEPDAGSLTLDGQAVRFRSPREARLAGIGIVHQELAFCENMSVAENMGLGNLPHRFLFVSKKTLREQARGALAAIGASLDVDTRVGEMPVGFQQLVQIAGAVAEGANALIFDEPTSSLSQIETARLLELIKSLKARGVTMVYISHRLEEIFEICDTVTILRDGELVDTRPVAGLRKDEIVNMMVGRELGAPAPQAPAATGPELLRVEGLSSPGRFEGISFALKAGEITALAGLVGSGRTELLHALFGLDPAARGSIAVAGRAVALGSPADAMRHGLGLVPEDRKRHGLVLGMTAGENISLPSLARLSRGGWIMRIRERGMAESFFGRLGVRAPHINAPAATLSGGNQQKLVIAKWLGTDSKVLLLDEPTRGIDVGAKDEIHALIRKLAANGCAILMASSELPEILALAHRILVMRCGRIVGELSQSETSENVLMRLMAGGGG